MRLLRLLVGGWMLLAAASAFAQSEVAEAALLEVAVAGFEHRSEAVDQADLALREAEARYFPYLLRDVLEASAQWGPIRLRPGPIDTAELQLRGTLLASAPGRLVVHLNARDSTGRLWLDRHYSVSATLEDYREDSGAEPFLPLFQAISEDLLETRDQLSAEDLRRITQVSTLRRAVELAPSVYRAYLRRDETGRYEVNRLPAAGDPLMARVERIIEARDLFIDTVDLRFRNYYAEVAPIYRLWRQSRLEADRLIARYRSATAADDSRELRGRYQDFRELKLYEQTLREQFSAFKFEVGPTTMALEGTLVELTGTLDEQYAQWRRLLERIHVRETGFSPETGAR